LQQTCFSEKDRRRVSGAKFFILAALLNVCCLFSYICQQLFNE
jgi:hypothetical protein